MPADNPNLVIRPCFQQDLETVQLIYAGHVMTGTGSFETEPPDLAEMSERWSYVVDNGWPYLVACPRSDVSRVLGFAYAAQFRMRPAYARCFEDSVYVAPTALRQGVGAHLLAELLSQLRSDGVREVLALIGDSENTASIGLHKAAGFRTVGKLEKAGEKFNRLLDVVIMQRTLASGG